MKPLIAQEYSFYGFRFLSKTVVGAMNTIAIFLLVTSLLVFKTHEFTIHRSDESAIDSSVDHSSDDVWDVAPSRVGGEQDNEDGTDDQSGYVIGGSAENERISEDGSATAPVASAEAPQFEGSSFEGSSL